MKYANDLEQLDMTSDNKNLVLDNAVVFEEILAIIEYVRVNAFRAVNRELSCLFGIELKIGCFKPEYLGQLEFYLEALDRDVKKQNENPDVGLILCAKKDDEVVEYALGRSMSPTMIAEYQTHFPQKALLTNNLCELRELAENLMDDKNGVVAE
jgi:hypothetical protein